MDWRKVVAQLLVPFFQPNLTPINISRWDLQCLTLHNTYPSYLIQSKFTISSTDLIYLSGTLSPNSLIDPNTWVMLEKHLRLNTSRLRVFSVFKSHISQSQSKIEWTAAHCTSGHLAYTINNTSRQNLTESSD